MKPFADARAARTDAWGETLPDAHVRAPEPGVLAELTVALAQAQQALGAGLAERLAGRVAAQREAQAALHTLRRPQAAPPQRAVGQRSWALGTHSRLVELDAGAELRLEPGTHELLLLEGRLLAGDQVVDLHGYLLGHGALRAERASRCYLRSHGAAGAFQVGAGWQHRPARQALWQPLREGVELHPLHQQGSAVSMLVRFAPGGRVPAHPHGVDEECLMVEGELFLGDVLLRQGGFQAAPAGSAHGELFADSPCLLYFHGAIDPAAVDNPWRARHGLAPL